MAMIIVRTTILTLEMTEVSDLQPVSTSNLIVGFIRFQGNVRQQDESVIFFYVILFSSF